MRIASGQRLGDRKSILVMLIVRAEIPREIETRIYRHPRAVLDPDAHLANSFLLVSSRKSHEKSQHAGDGRKGVDVIVVEAESGSGVGHIGIKLERAHEFGAACYACVGDGALFIAERIEACLQRVA